MFGFTDRETSIRIMFLSYSDTTTPSVDIDQVHPVGGATLESQRIVWTVGEREITGVHVTMTLPSKNTLEETKQNLSALWANSGPHAFVLTVPTNVHFTERRRREFQTHLELLGNTVWDQAIVGFFVTENLSTNYIEDYIETEGKALQWLVKKCANRYVHWKGRDSRTDLLRRIDEMVAARGRGIKSEYDRRCDMWLVTSHGNEDKSSCYKHT